jgi:hypothetical protein
MATKKGPGEESFPDELLHEYLSAFPARHLAERWRRVVTGKRSESGTAFLINLRRSC